MPDRASSIGRGLLCPGWARLWRQVAKDLPADDSAVAESGTRIHAAVAHEFDDMLPVPDGLTDDEAECAQRCVEFAHRKIDEFCGVAEAVVHVEMEMVLDEPGVHVTGHPDLLVVASADGGECKDCLVLDWKTGWRGVDPSGVIAQFQALIYGAMAIRATGADTATCVIYEPRSGDAHTGLIDDVDDVIAECRRLQAEESDELVPGDEQCKYCPAAALCPALAAMAETAVAERPDQLPADPDVLGALLDRAKVAKRFVESVESYCRSKALEEGILPTGYQVVERRGNRYVPDPVSAWEQVKDVVPEKEYMHALKISAGELERLFVEHFQGRGGKKEFERRTDGVVRRGKTQVYLSRRKR